MNPGVARLAIVIALVIGGVAVLANGFSDGETAAAPPGDRRRRLLRRVRPRHAPREQSIVPNQEGVLVQVLNGTSQAGYAGDFQILLEEEGYLRAGEPADAPDKPVLDSIVYFRRDDNKAQNRADAQLLSETYLGGVPVNPMPATLADVVVGVGGRGRRARRGSGRHGLTASGSLPVETSESTSSQSSLGRNGLVRKSEAPSPWERSRSARRDLAVSTRTGMSDVCSSCLSVSSTS